MIDGDSSSPFLHRESLLRPPGCQEPANDSTAAGLTRALETHLDQ
jgi:hypothetical protein